MCVPLMMLRLPFDRDARVLMSSMSSSDELIQRILGDFKFVEPNEEELLEDLARLTGEAENKSIPHGSGTDVTGASEPETQALSDALSRLSMVDEDKSLPRKIDDKATKLRELALQAKQAGNLELAKEYLHRLKQLRSPSMEFTAVDNKIEQVQSIVKRTSTPDPVAELKRKALDLKRAGDLDGALKLMRKAAELGGSRPSKERINNFLKTSLARQCSLCNDAIKHYKEIGDLHKFQLFTNRKEAAEQDLQRLTLDVESGQEPPGYKEAVVSFETHDLNSDVADKDMIMAVRVESSLGKDVVYQLKVIFEWPPNADSAVHERMLNLSVPQNEWSLPYRDCITRDIRQQKFFEHRRLKFELLVEEKQFLFFSNLSTVATGHLKLSPLTTQSTLSSEVRLVDSAQRKHSCTLHVIVKLRRPIVRKDPVKHQAKFIYVPSYNLYEGCEYGCDDADDVFISYVALEKEIERLSAMRSLEAQSKLIELEGRRGELQLKVDTGQLTMADYLQQVRTCIASTRKRIVELKKKGNLDKAKQLLGFLRLMEDEVAEAEQNLKESD